jgi:glutaredoxin
MEITFLTQASCSSCERAKEILSRIDLEYSINIQEVKLNSDEGKKLAIQHGVFFAPGILVDGQLLSYGRLSENKLRNRLSTVDSRER